MWLCAQPLLGSLHQTHTDERISCVCFILLLGNIVKVLALVPLEYLLNENLIQDSKRKIWFLPGFSEARRLNSMVEAMHSQGSLTICLGSFDWS